VNKVPLLLSSLIAFALLQSSTAFALGSGLAGGAGQPGKAVPAVPYGGAYSASQNGKRPQDLKRPSATSCALHEQTRGITTPTSRSGDIYADCSGSKKGSFRPRSANNKPASAYNARTNTLKAASDGYVNRSASSAMMPKKAPSMYDPATGVLKPSKKQNAYQIYQQ